MMDVRDLGAADLDRLVELEGASLGVDAWTRGMIEEEFGRPGGLFLGLGQPLQGFVCAWVVFDELHLLQIAVAPAARRAGLGSLLHAALLDRCRGRASAGWLEVRADNEAACGLYSRLGWMPVGRRPGYYADGEDALVFRLDPLFNQTGEGARRPFP